MKEFILEITSSMKQNKLRTFLTGFSVSWGIFMLMILLGSGNGLRNGVESNFSKTGSSVNTITLWSNSTQIPHMGYAKGRSINLKYNDVDYILDKVEEVKRIVPERFLSSGNATYSPLNTTISVYARGTTAGFEIVKSLIFKNGRTLNESDINGNRKVVVINEYAAESLFRNEEPLGKTIAVDDIFYTVVGVYAENNNNGSASVYMPITTSYGIYNIATVREINSLTLEVEGIETLAQSEAVEQKIRATLAEKHSFSPLDVSAVWINNAIEDYMQFLMVFNGINMFIWIIGLGTLMAGIVGVSNIMLVTVRERTNEFGIRKSLGASPSSIVRLIIAESVAITLFFGYTGLVIGAFIMEIVSQVVEMINVNTENVIFTNPTIDLGIVINATIVLVIAGTLAGYMPARKAAMLKTIDAMRYNK